MATDTVAPPTVENAEPLETAVTPEPELEAIHNAFHRGISLLRVLERVAGEDGDVEFEESLTLAIEYFDGALVRLLEEVTRLSREGRNGGGKSG